MEPFIEFYGRVLWTRTGDIIQHCISSSTRLDVRPDSPERIARYLSFSSYTRSKYSLFLFLSRFYYRFSLTTLLALIELVPRFLRFATFNSVYWPGCKIINADGISENLTRFTKLLRFRWEGVQGVVIFFSLSVTESGIRLRPDSFGDVAWPEGFWCRIEKKSPDAAFVVDELSRTIGGHPAAAAASQPT